MDEIFNPYLEWLGIRGAAQPPTQYRLLGLDPFEDDAHVIENAGEGVIARVRSYRPGKHAIEWQQLLDELEAAKLCLLDPQCKARYDMELRSRTSGTSERTPTAQADDRGEAAASLRDAGGLDLWPPEAEDGAKGSGGERESSRHSAPVARPVTNAPPAPLAMPVSQSAPPPAPSADRSIPAPLASIVPMAGPQATPAPAASYPMGAADPMAPVNYSQPSSGSAGYPQGNVGVPMASPAGASSPDPSALPVGKLASHDEKHAPNLRAATTTSQSYRKSVRKNSSATMVTTTIVVSLLVMAGLIAFAVNGGSRAKPTAAAGRYGDSKTGLQPSAPAEKPPRPAPRTEEKPKPNPSRPKSTVIGPAPAPQPSTPEPQPKSDPIPLPIPKPAPEPDPAPNPDPSPEPKPEPEPEPETPPAPEPKPAADPTPVQIAKVEKALVEIRAALAERDIAEANDLVDAAAPDALGEALEQELNAARLLIQGVENFWDAVRDGGKALNAGEVIEVGSTPVAIVESNPDKLIIRMLGKNRSYAWDSLPAGLARQFAEAWFDSEAPSSKFAIGAFLVVDPNGDKNEARTLWKQAAAGGLEIEHLMPLLDEKTE